MQHAEDSHTEDSHTNTTETPIQLRVRNHRGLDRIVPLGMRMTIGSSASCDIRLDEVNPVQCFVIKGAAGTIVRRWQGNVELNGQQVEDAWLTSGDTVRFGENEIRLFDGPLEQSKYIDSESAQSRHARTASNDLGEQTEYLNSQVSRLTAECESLNTDLAEKEATIANLDDQLQAALKQTASPQGQTGDDSQFGDSEFGDSEQNRTELESCNAELVRRSQGLDERQKEIELQFTELQKLREELEQARGELRTAHQEFTSQKESWELEQHNLIAQFESVRSAYEHERANVDARQRKVNSVDDEPSQNDYVIDEGSANYGLSPDSEYTTNYSDENDSQFAANEEELEFSSVSDESPIDTASVLAKYGVLDDETDESSSTADTLDSELNSSRSDESINEYMSELLGRVGGLSTQPKDDESTSTPSEAGDARIPEGDIQSGAAIDKEKLPPLRAEDFVPRSKQPNLDLNTMRSIANETARSAINQHARRKNRANLLVQWFMVVCLAVAGVILWMFGTFFAQAGSALTMVLGVYMSMRATGFITSTRSMEQKLDSIKEKKQKKQRQKKLKE